MSALRWAGRAGVAAVVAVAVWRITAGLPYRIDTDVYRMGGRAWLDGGPLYDGRFGTEIGLNLPSTYPPLAAIAFSPLALMGQHAAEIAVTLAGLAGLTVSAWIVLTRLQVPAGIGRGWLAAGIAAASAVMLEPVWSNFRLGQINIILMTLVIADCVPRRTPWPRGLLVGLAIALKLTPGIFLLYFLLRRDLRAVLWAAGGFAGATAIGFLLAPRDSARYWSGTVAEADRVGSAALNTNQNIAGALARLDLGGLRSALWVAACLLVVVLAVWAVRRVLAAGEPVLALACVALLGLLVSPVSWSHHWVWALPVLIATTVAAVRRRNVPLGVLTLAGAALMVWPPIGLLPEHREFGAAWWRQLLGMS
jgi:alpha-1,2-mannosyltransferase